MEKTQQQPKKKRLSKKQKGFVKDYILSGNGELSALNNYEIEGKDKENIARSIASQNLTKLNVIEAIEKGQETLKSALQKKGITPEKIADKINVLLDAEDLETGKKDYTAIDKGLKHAKEIYGVESIEDKPKTNTTYNFIFNEDTQGKIKELNEAIKNKLLNGNV